MIIYKEDLEKDVIKGEYLDQQAKIYVTNGEVYDSCIDYYSHDEEPYIKYIDFGNFRIPFDDIEKIEILD
ncbi:MAG: hypothetical protein Q4D88_01370 [Anaerococcus sp.]|nr:hypothetical protein [Anaerococcus sp.]